MTFKTHYSFRRATGSPEEVVLRLKELGYNYAPISDIDSTFGWKQWSDNCVKNDIKPIFGVSIHVTESINAKKPPLDLFTFYAAKDLKSVNEIVALAYKQGRSLPRVGFTPIIRYDQLAKFDDVIIVSGYKARLEAFKPKENIFVGLSPACTKGYVRRASELGFSFFPMQEQRFVNKEDAQFYEIAAGFNADLKTYPQWITSPEKFSADISASDWTNRNFVFAQCTATINKGDLLRPTENVTLRQLCSDGAKRLNLDIESGIYAERLKEELDIIEGKNFSDYFVITADMIQWAKKRMLVGPGRGSSAGSLVCYLLDITNVDPIEHKLLFFRFLDPSRPDMPDIDTDYSDRDAVIEYLVNKYGKDRVARIGTVGSFQATNTTNEVTKQLRMPRFEFNQLLDSIEKMSANDARKDKSLETALNETAAGKRILSKYPAFKVAGNLTGTPSHSSTHASGVLVANEAISHHYAINPLSQSVMCQADDAESIGLVKIDVLGLNSLNIFQKTLELASKPLKFLDTIPLDDQKTFDVLNDHKFSGLFQYEGAAVRTLSQKIKVDCFNDFVAISALARPGALNSGSAESWCRRKMGQEQVESYHPIIEPFFKDTLGVLTYQEQVMLLARECAGMSWQQVSKLRKAIGKSMGAEAMKEYGEPFISGLVKAGVPEDISNKVWSYILNSGSYLFNLSHSVCYGLLSYQSAYLKAHFPLEFATAQLCCASTKEKQMTILRELVAEGVTYTPFDPELSDMDWRIVTKGENKHLIGPLSSVKGLGPKSVSQIMACRSRNEPLPDSLKKKMDNAVTEFDSLTPIADWLETNNARRHVTGEFTKMVDVVPDGTWQDLYIAGVCTIIAERDENDQKRVEDRVARGQAGIMQGNSKYVEIRLSDDTGIFYVKIGAKDYEQLGTKILTEGREKKTMIVGMATLCPEAPVLLLKKMRIVGEI